MTTEDPVSYEIQEIVLLPLSWHKREQTYDCLTASERRMKQQSFVSRIHFFAQVLKQSCVGSSCFDEIDNSNCNCNIKLNTH